MEPTAMAQPMQETRANRSKANRVWVKDKARRFQRRLLTWYESQRRDLPWRTEPHPYRVWVSEIMLQQTQVRAVLPYYARFLERFPDVESLAHSSEGEVLSLWAGLGYYSRARNLRLAAQKIIRDFRGRFPDKLGDLLELPGIGRYTAGAILSIAFNSPQPIVDGNVKRVISRLHGIRDGAPEAFFWEQAGAWVSRTQPADFNQAVMELGALVCTRRSPGCGSCPVSGFCEARKMKIQDRIPAPRSTRAPERVELVMLILDRGGELLVGNRRDFPFIPGPHALPVAVLNREESPEAAAKSLARSILGTSIRPCRQSRINHAITYRRLVVHSFYASIDSHRSVLTAPSGYEWVPRSELNRLLTSALYRKALAA
jgi:A/G-specific adenine glycosylase